MLHYVDCIVLQRITTNEKLDRNSEIICSNAAKLHNFQDINREIT